jgi:hypothetical protein
MSLSPVSAIADMVAPVVLITLSTIFANGLMIVNAALAERLFTLNRERRGILRGSGGELLDEDSVSPMDRERLMEIRDVTPLIIRRFRRLRSAVLMMWITIGLLVLSVAAIAAAVTANSEPVAFTALALILAGVALFFFGVATVISPNRSMDALIDETKRTGLPS